MTKTMERVRLKADHYHDGIKKRAGSVVKVSEFIAAFLEKERKGVRLNKRKK